MALKYKWRRFKPKQKSHENSHEMLALLDDVDHAYDFTQNLKTRALPNEKYDDAERYHMQLIAQTPRAVLAQRQMDEHKHGFHHKEKRLYELIDFNDSFVSYILALPEQQLYGVVDRLHDDMKQFCQRLKTPMFDDRQFEAIVHGLSREIAVFRGATKEGFTATMTSRTDDAFGIDMVLRDEQTGKSVNVDCKTARAFHYRLDDFVRQGRISQQDAERAEANDFVTLINKRDDQAVPVTTLCIRVERLGEIVDFEFSDTTEFGNLLRAMFKVAAH